MLTVPCGIAVLRPLLTATAGTMRRARVSAVTALTLVGSVESFLLYTPTIARGDALSLAVPSMSAATASTFPPVPSLGTKLETAPNTRIPGGELLSLGVEGVSEVLGGLGRAKMVWAAIADGVDPFSSEGLAGFLTDKTSGILHDNVEALPWKVVQESVSSCGTRKLLVRLEDGLEVETVVIPCLSGARSTVCVSSQIGCAKNCQFCMTGKMGLVRNLTAGEILGQVYFARKAAREHGMPPLTNVVYMGMGEPLDNPFAVTRSLEVLTHPHAFAMAKSKISVSTVGPSPGAIRRMIGMPSRLAWSVHAATDEVRRLLVPTTVHKMTELRDAFADVLQSRRREHLFVEVVLIDGLNDSPDLARALADLLRPLPRRASVNLLPYNDTGHALFRASSKEAVEEFQRVLTEEGLIATIRTARGDEESSACGQLATSAKNDRAKRRRHEDVDTSLSPAEVPRL